MAHLTFFLLFLFYPLSFVESHIAVLLVPFAFSTICSTAVSKSSFFLAAIFLYIFGSCEVLWCKENKDLCQLVAEVEEMFIFE